MARRCQRKEMHEFRFIGGCCRSLYQRQDKTDKPFYKAVEEVRFVDNKSFTSELNSNYGAYIVSLDMALEEMPLTGNCTVVWDDVSREHPVVEAELEGEKYHGFGNLAFFASFGIAGENTGEPYAVLVLPSGYAMAFTTDTAATEHTVSILADAPVYHPMEQSYLNIPTLDFVSLGLPTIQQTSDAFEVSGDFSAVMDLLLKNWVVKVRYNFQTGDVYVYEGIAMVHRNTSTAEFMLCAVAINRTVSFKITRTGITAWHKNI